MRVRITDKKGEIRTYGDNDDSREFSLLDGDRYFEVDCSQVRWAWNRGDDFDNESLESYRLEESANFPLNDRYHAIPWIVIPYTLSGDYVGSYCELSNRKYMEENHDNIEIAHYGYGGTEALVRADRFTDSMAEDIKSLESYPVLDESLMSELEMEGEVEAWNDWAKKDFCRELEKLWGEYTGLDASDFEALPNLATVFHMVADRSSTYWESENLNMVIDLERIAKACTEDDIIAMGLSEGTTATMKANILRDSCDPNDVNY